MLGKIDVVSSPLLAENIVSVQPMTNHGGIDFFLKPRWQPCVIDRLAALTDPEMRERVDDYDQMVEEDRKALSRLRESKTRYYATLYVTNL